MCTTPFAQVAGKFILTGPNAVKKVEIKHSCTECIGRMKIRYYDSNESNWKISLPGFI